MEEDSSPEVTSSPTEVEAGLRFHAYHSDVILEGGPYQVNDGLLGHRIRVTYGDAEVFNQTGVDDGGLLMEARDAVRRFKAKHFPDDEEEFDLG